MPDRDHHISLAEAVKLVTSRKPVADEPRAWRFSRKIIDEILAQPDCDGLRIYLGGNGADTTVVVVGTRDDGKDMADGVLAEMAWPCPFMCDDESPLSPRSA